ncbi:MAG: tetratricopeptide repeat protein [Chitinophagaceae bacterium]|nr:tetratricopeptide repeat protein [Chitinophagaceae bacterium]
MHKFLFVCLLMIGMESYTQQTKIDSVLKELNRSSLPDTFRVNNLINAALSIYESDENKGLQFANEAILLSQKLNNHALDRALMSKGLIYKQLQSDSLAITNFLLAAQEAQNGGNGLLQIRCLFNASLCYNNLSNYTKALECVQKSLNITQTIDAPYDILIRLHNGVGASFYSMTRYREAEAAYFKALKIAEKNTDTLFSGIILRNLGMVNKAWKHFDRALQYYKRSLGFLTLAKNNQQLAGAYQSLGILMSDTQKPEEAIHYFENAYEINKKIGLKIEMARNLVNIGVDLNTLKRHRKAFIVLQEALELNKSFQNAAINSVAYNELNDIFTNAPDSVLINLGIKTKAERYKLALEYGQKSLSTAIEIEDAEKKASAYHNLSRSYLQLGNYKLAYDFLEKYTNVNDSLIREQSKVTISQLEATYEQEKQKAEADDKLENAREEKKLLIVIALVVLFFLILAFIFYKKQRDSKQVQQELLVRSQIAEIEMKALRLQMNPHFIFNALNSIADFIRKNDTEKADFYLAKFSKLMRSVLENSQEKEIPLSDELKSIELYLQLEIMRLGGHIQYTIDVDAEINTDTVMIPPLILQPFVENAIWHGLSNKKEDGKIIIRITKDNAMLHLAVEDNGPGLRNSPKKEGKKSFGVSITKDKIELLNKLKKTNASITLIDIEQGTRASVNIPFETTDV